jgi:ABC-type transport system involved in cytochrome c biogenesis ATPase subunit
MQFTVLPVSGSPPSGSRAQAFLRTDNWDDYTYKTQFALTYVDQEGERHYIGQVKIASVDMGSGHARTELPPTFERLSPEYFALGQSDAYYVRLRELGSLGDEILRDLRDIALDLELFDRALEENVTGTSLLRNVTTASVRGQLNRLANGGVRLTQYSFEYALASSRKDVKQPRLSFEVHPNSQPPTNIHVLIGRNGVGKTHLLHDMIGSLADESGTEEFGVFESESDDTADELFANLVSVSFSAFDRFEPLPDRPNKADGLRYSYVGLKRVRKPKDEEPPPPKSPDELAEEFVDSVWLCRQGPRSNRWLHALKSLEADPIFRDADIASLASEDETDTKVSKTFEARARNLFARLSSGHKIVLLTITRLVETVEERSLVLLDEPEAHLHPPLLAAFVRSLSDLMTDRNGVAIIATHSPVILQEVPQHCVWKIRRTGAVINVDRPDIETFGENVGTLTREVFGLEVTDSGFYRLLQKSVDEHSSYEWVVNEFGGQLGGEALALLRSMLAAQLPD